MIYDKIENIDLYKLDSDAVNFIKNLKSDIECKKHILNDNVYANVEEYNTKESGFFEAHKNYIDIQLLLSGEERLEYTNLEGLNVQTQYDESRDIEFYFDGKNPVIPLILKPDFFAVLFPQDAHKPQLTYQTEQKVKKVVVKIKCGQK